MGARRFICEIAHGNVKPDCVRCPHYLDCDEEDSHVQGNIPEREGSPGDEGVHVAVSGGEIRNRLRFSQIPGQNDLYFDPATGIVYIITHADDCYSGYGYMSPYYASNGLPYVYENGTLTEIKESDEHGDGEQH